MLQLPNSPIFEGQEKKTLPLRHLHAGSTTFATIFFDGSSNKQIGESLLGCFWFYAGKIILVPRLGEDGDFWSNERSYRTEGIPGWWQFVLNVHPYLGEMMQFDLRIFF